MKRIPGLLRRATNAGGRAQAGASSLNTSIHKVPSRTCVICAQKNAAMKQSAVTPASGVQDPRFNHLVVPTVKHIQALSAILSPANVAVVANPQAGSLQTNATSEELDPSISTAVAGSDMVTDWMKQYRTGAPFTCVVFPSDAEQVAAVLRYCTQERIGVVPQGGNTGLVGGGVPISHEIVLSMRRMNKIHSIDEATGVVIADAGCILQHLDEECGKVGYAMPVDLGAKGSCHIGGNVSTNAGGLRYLRYGSLHGTVLGLEAVTGNGVIMDCMSSLRKDNVGFDVKQLFIGSEGCLGLVTKVAIQAVPKPNAVNVAMFGLPTFPACVEVYKRARKELGEILSAVEFVDAATMEITLQQLHGANPAAHPLPDKHPFYMVVETHGSHADHDTEKLNRFLESLLSSEDAGGAMLPSPGATTGTASTTPRISGVDGTVAADGKQARQLWSLREDAAVGVSRRGHVYKYDMSFHIPRMYDIVEVMRQRLEVDLGWRERANVRVVGYGHLGDGNIHLNISTPSRNQPYHAELAADVEPFVSDWAMAQGGSVSAEHGLGQAKAKLLSKAKPHAVVAAMWALKQQFDPAGILNPGKVLAKPLQ